MADEVGYQETPQVIAEDLKVSIDGEDMTIEELRALAQTIILPEWAKTDLLQFFLTTYLIPFAMTAHAKTVWVRESSQELRFLGPIVVTPDKNIEMMYELKYPDPSLLGKDVTLEYTRQYVKWEETIEINPDHMFISCFEVSNKEIDPPRFTISVNNPDSLEIFNNPAAFNDRPYSSLTVWFSPEGIKQWIHNPGELIEAVSNQEKTTRRARPSDAVKLQPFDKNLQLWTNNNLTKMVLEVATSNPEAWKPFTKRNGFTLETDSGTAILENIGTFDNLKKILDMLGPEGLQYTLATLSHIEEHVRKKYSTPPETITGLNPMKIVVTDLLRSMGRKSGGNTFSREQQFRPRHFLKAQSMVEYADIKPTVNGKAKVTVGPLINILNTELETCLPFEDIPDSGEVVSITVLPGEAVYELMRHGMRWCHPQLLKYHPIRRKYEIAIGFYVQQLAVNKRNKQGQGQDYVSIRSIIKGSGVDSFDRGNMSRLLTRVEEALNRIAEAGMIPGQTSASGTIKAIFMEDKTITDPIERMLEKKVKVIHPESLPTGYTPLPTNKNG